MFDEKKSRSLKKPTTYQEQIELLISRGIVIRNVEKAVEVLKRISYYRLSAYGLSLKKEKDMYLPGTTFEHIYRLYDFDSKLRALLLSISEYVEISFRTQLIHYLGHKYGELGYREESNFRNSRIHWRFMQRLEELLGGANELFVLHHEKNYGGQFPIWAAFEVTTFGMLSTLFKNLKTADKKQLARDYYDVAYYSKISSWLHSISVVRNRCAHYNRIYNKSLSVAPSLPNGTRHLEIDNNQLFSVVYILKKLVTNHYEWNIWVTQLEALLEAYPEVDLDLLGFKNDWIEILRNDKL